ncbi:MAG: type III-A CRISPR-associated RAMP protein Csm5, partial [Candidatus Heimdallarchaeaceae archaeon]
VGRNVDISVELKEHIKTKNKLYIPGSSIKGAILSAVINTALTELAELSQAFEEFVRNIAEKKEGFRDERTINDTLIGIALRWLSYKEKLSDDYKKIDKDAIRDLKSSRFDQWIQVTDTNSVTPEKNGMILPLERKGGEAPPPILAELIRQNKELKFELSLLNKEQKVKLKDILKIVDEYYRKLYEDEIKWCNEKKINHRLQPIEKKENEFLIRIGFGTGNKAISLIPTMQKLDPTNKLLATYGKEWKLTKSGGAVSKSKWFAVIQTKEKEEFYYPLGWAKIVLD